MSNKEYYETKQFIAVAVLQSLRSEKASFTTQEFAQRFDALLGTMRPGSRAWRFTEWPERVTGYLKTKARQGVLVARKVRGRYVWSFGEQIIKQVRRQDEKTN